MKKALYLIATILFISCGTAQTGDSDVKMNKRTLKGTWEVTNIRFVGEKGLYKAKLFDLADSACFKDSQWVFIPNNGSGKFTVNEGAHCEASSSRMHWSFFEPGDGSYKFQFKYVDEKNKPLSNQGYRGNIDALTENSMTLRVPTTYNGEPFDVIMTYTKVSDDIKL